MPEPNDFELMIRSKMKMINSYAESLSEMSPDERISELGNLSETKGNLERELSDTDLKIAAVEAMPDVAEHLIGKNEFAVRLLGHLREIDGSSYTEFIEEYDEGLTRGIVLKNLLILKNAGRKGVLRKVHDRFICDSCETSM